MWHQKVAYVAVPWQRICYRNGVSKISSVSGVKRRMAWRSMAKVWRQQLSVAWRMANQARGIKHVNALASAHQHQRQMAISAWHQAAIAPQ